MKRRRNTFEELTGEVFHDLEAAGQLLGESTRLLPTTKGRLALFSFEMDRGGLDPEQHLAEWASTRARSARGEVQ